MRAGEGLASRMQQETQFLAVNFLFDQQPDKKGTMTKIKDFMELSKEVPKNFRYAFSPWRHRLGASGSK